MPSQLGSYKNGHVYLLDDVNPNDQEEDEIGIALGQPKQNNPHTIRLGLMRTFFQQLTDYEVHPVFFPPRSTENAFFEFWDEELRTKTSDDLVIIYYHGNAGWNGLEYSFDFAGYPRRPINAYELVQKLNGSGVDCMLILDCYIPTRFHEKWQRSHGTTEILARGVELQNAKGQSVDDPCNFTNALAYGLYGFVKHIDSKYKNHRREKSIAQLLASNKLLNANPVRIDIGRPKADCDQAVKRFVISPADVRETGMMKFFYKKVKGGNAADSPKEDDMDGALFLEEGLGNRAADEDANSGALVCFGNKKARFSAARDDDDDLI